MGDGTKIEWTDATWNPIVGCSVISPGCTNCYAMRMAARLERMLPPERRGDVVMPNQYAALTKPSKGGPVWTGRVNIAPDHLVTAPLRWRRPRRIFVNSMSDLFHESVSNAWIDLIFAVMALARQHTFQVLTKRPERMRDYFMPGLRSAHDRVSTIAYPMSARFQRAGMAPIWPLPNVWLGVSVEDQRRADERVPILLDTPAAVRWVSAEPMLGPIDLRQWQHDYGCGCGWGGDSPLDYCPACGWRGHAHGEIGTAKCPVCCTIVDDNYACPECDGHDGDGMSFGPNSRPRIDWVVAGGESGPDARPMHPDWARSLRDQCAAAGVPFLFKQWGEFADPAAASLDLTQCFAKATTGGWIEADGRSSLGEAAAPITTGSVHVFRVGKKAAGRLLDGVLHDAYPEVRTHA